MKKIIIFLLLLICLLSCRQHVYYTYYGKIDIDTLDVLYDKDGHPYYPLFYTEMTDSQASTMGLTTLDIVTFYKPSQDVYFSRAFGSDGGSSPRIYFNPYTGKTDSIK